MLNLPMLIKLPSEAGRRKNVGSALKMDVQEGVLKGSVQILVLPVDTKIAVEKIAGTQAIIVRNCRVNSVGTLFVAQ